MSTNQYFYVYMVIFLFFEFYIFRYVKKNYRAKKLFAIALGLLMSIMIYSFFPNVVGYERDVISRYFELPDIAIEMFILYFIASSAFGFVISRQISKKSNSG